MIIPWKRKGVKITLEKWYFSLKFLLFAVHIDSCGLIVSILYVDINIEKLENMLGISWVDAHGNKASLHIKNRYTHNVKGEEGSMTSDRKGSLQ